MITRFLAAVVGLAVLVPAIVYGGTVAVEIIVPFAAVVGLGEYATMAFPDDRWVMGSLLGLLWAGIYASALYWPHEFMLCFGAVGVITLVVQTLRPGDSLDRTADQAGRLLLGAVWLGLLTFLPLLRREEHGLALVFMVLAISWLGDTGAYFAGRYFGKNKLYEKISPKKTWEGVAGGVTLATVGALVVRALGLPELSMAECLVLAPALCLVGVVGDLAESMLKRSFEVKDSGWILPGHGGLLDRIDSLLFVAPLLYAWVRVMEA